MHLPACFASLILTFAPVFVQQRTWRRAELLLVGAILAPGKRTVTSLLRIAGLGRERRFTNYHRVLNRAAWDARAAARLLLGLLIAVFAPSGPVLLGIDDTIEERRRGKRISAKAIYRDPVRSSKGHFVKASGLPLRSRLRGCDAFGTGSTALPLLAQPDAPGPGPVGRAHLGASVPHRAGTFGALLPRARQAAQKADGLGKADGPPGTSLAARARGRAAGRQQLRPSGVPGDAGSAWPPRHHAPAAGCGAVRAGAASPARDGRAAAYQRRTPAEPLRGAAGWQHMLAAGGHARLVWGAGARGRDLFSYRHLAPCRLAGPTNPLGAAARSAATLRPAGTALHRSRLRPATGRALVRPTLADGGHLPRGARPSRRRNPASVVGPRHRPHHALPARPVLDRDTARCAPRPPRPLSGLHRCLVPQTAADLRRRPRRCPAAVLA